MIGPPRSCRGGRQDMCNLKYVIIALSRHTRGRKAWSAGLFSIRGLCNIVVIQSWLLASSSKWLCWVIDANHNFHWWLLLWIARMVWPPRSCRGRRQAMCDLKYVIIALSRHTRGREAWGTRLFSIRGLWNILVPQAYWLASSSKWLSLVINLNHYFEWL